MAWALGQRPAWFSRDLEAARRHLEAARAEATSWTADLAFTEALLAFNAGDAASYALAERALALTGPHTDLWTRVKCHQVVAQVRLRGGAAAMMGLEHRGHHRVPYAPTARPAGQAAKHP